MTNLRSENLELERGSDQPSRYGRSKLNWIEDRLGPYSYVQLFRRHMTVARENLRETVRYLKPKSKPRFAPIIAARCAVGNAGLARWISEVEPEKVVERTIERELANIFDEQRILTLAGGNASQFTKDKKKELLNYANANRIDLSEITDRKGKVNPRSLTRIMELLDAKYQAPDSDGTYKLQSPWSLSSAMIHGSEYPSRMLNGLIVKDDNNQMIGLSPIVISGFVEAAKKTYEDAMSNYRALVFNEATNS